MPARRSHPQPVLQIGLTSAVLERGTLGTDVLFYIAVPSQVRGDDDDAAAAAVVVV